MARFLVQTVPSKLPELLINLSSQGPHLMGLSPHGGDLQPTCAKRPAHKRTGDRDFLLPSAAQRVQLRTNTAQRVLGGVRRRVFAARRH